MMTYLCHFKLHSSDRLAICNGKVRRQSWMTNDRGEGVAMLMREPVAVTDKYLEN
jgi:hypothetical protein